MGLIGAHVPVAGGLATGGLAYAAAVGAEAVQLFVSNPRAWATLPGDPGQDAALRAAGLPVYVHASRAPGALETLGDAAGRVRLVHANDSAAACGSRLDRHANIGAGQIGVAPFGELLRHPALASAAFIVETPGGQQAQAADIATLKALRDPAQQAVAATLPERPDF